MCAQLQNVRLSWHLAINFTKKGQRILMDMTHLINLLPKIIAKLMRNERWFDYVSNDK